MAALSPNHVCTTGLYGKVTQQQLAVRLLNCNVVDIGSGTTDFRELQPWMSVHRNLPRQTCPVNSLDRCGHAVHQLSALAITQHRVDRCIRTSNVGSHQPGRTPGPRELEIELIDGAKRCKGLEFRTESPLESLYNVTDVIRMCCV